MESFTWHMVIQEVLQDSIFKNQRRKGGKEQERKNEREQKNSLKGICV